MHRPNVTKKLNSYVGSDIINGTTIEITCIGNELR